jgi:hypothetical protein
MHRTLAGVIALWLLAGAAAFANETAAPADAPKAAPKPGGDHDMAGMSVVGNDDAPKALVIVPWKSSGLGDVLDVSRALDDGRQPVDRDVFMRELDYYEIREGSRAN